MICPSRATNDGLSQLMPTYLRVRSYCLVVVSVGLCLIDVCNNTALTIHAEATAFIQCSVDFLCRESVSKSVAFARANVVAMSSEEEQLPCSTRGPAYGWHSLTNYCSWHSSRDPSGFVCVRIRRYRHRYCALSDGQPAPTLTCPCPTVFLLQSRRWRHAMMWKYSLKSKRGSSCTTSNLQKRFLTERKGEDWTLRKSIDCAVWKGKEVNKNGCCHVGQRCL